MSEDKYTVVHDGEYEKFCEKVQYLIDHGWKPQGGICVETRNRSILTEEYPWVAYFQAMVFEGKSNDQD